MGYGITSKSQLIDVGTIQSGCQAYINALDFFETGGKQLVDAGSLCNAQALSVDGCSFQADIDQMGQSAIQEKAKLINAATSVYNEAVSVYNAQVKELNEYNRRMAEQRAKANRRSC